MTERPFVTTRNNYNYFVNSLPQINKNAGILSGLLKGVPSALSRFGTQTAERIPGILSQIGKIPSGATNAVRNFDWQNLIGKGIDKSVGLLDKSVEAIKSRPGLESMVKKITDYRFMDPRNATKNLIGGTVFGSTTGGGTGFLSGIPGLFQDQKVDDESFLGKLLGLKRDATLGEKLLGLGKRTAIGAGVGAVPGAALGKYGPGLAQKGIGRVVTNVMFPAEYSMEGRLKDVPIKSILSAIWHDKPLDIAMPRDVNFNWVTQEAPGRWQLFRDYFNLPHFKGMGPVSDANQLKLVGVENGQKIYKFNPFSEAGRSSIDYINGKRRAAFDVSNVKNPVQIGKNFPEWEWVMGNFHVKPSGAYEDVWDFAAHSGESIKDKSDLARRLVSMFGNPSKIVGKTFSEGAAIKNFSGNLNSLIKLPFKGKDTPLHEIIASDLNVDPKRVASYLFGLSGNVPKGAAEDIKRKLILREVANLVQGKPTNFAEAIAKAEKVPVQDVSSVFSKPIKATTSVINTRAPLSSVNPVDTFSRQ